MQRVSDYIRGNERDFPEELIPVAFLHAHNIPLAIDRKSLGKAPARMVDDMTVLINGIADAREWQRLEAERKAKGGK